MQMSWHTAMKRTSRPSCGEWKNSRVSLLFIQSRSRGDPQGRVLRRFDRRRIKQYEDADAKVDCASDVVLCPVASWNERHRTAAKDCAGNNSISVLDWRQLSACRRL